MKRSWQARLAYVKNINRNVPSTWRWARGDQAKGDRKKSGWQLLCAVVLYVGNTHCSPLVYDRLTCHVDYCTRTQSRSSYGHKLYTFRSILGHLIQHCIFSRDTHSWTEFSSRILQDWAGLRMACWETGDCYYFQPDTLSLCVSICLSVSL